MTTTDTVEPGRYDYDLTITFPSVYIPDHTPPRLRATAGYETTRTRRFWGQFDLKERVDRDILRDHLVRKSCDDLAGQTVAITSFTLTPA